jgi:hypothetical protein
MPPETPRFDTLTLVVLLAIPLLWRRPGIGIPVVPTGVTGASSLEHVLRLLGVRNPAGSSSVSSRSARPLTLTEWLWRLPPSELRGRMGVRALEKLVRLGGRAIEVRLGGRAIEVRLSGRADDDILARELERDMEKSDSALALVGPRLGRGPKDRRLTPDVLSRGMWRPGFVGVPSSPWIDCDELATELGPRLRDLTETLDDTLVGPIELRGDMADGVDAPGPGSFDLARWTRSSRRCIWAVRLRMWDRELEPGALFDIARVVRAAGGAPLAAPPGVRSIADPVVADRVPGVRPLEVSGRMRGLAAACWSIDCIRVFRISPADADAGWKLGARGSGADASDIGGDGGSVSSVSSGMLSPASDFMSVGVVMSGELVAELGDDIM